MDCAGAVVGAEERVVRVIEDGILIYDGGSDMGIVIGSGIGDGYTHFGIAILVEVQVISASLRAVGLRADRLCTVVVRVCEQRCVAKLDTVQRMTCLVLIDGGGDAVSRCSGAILLREGQGIGAGGKWAVRKGRVRSVGEGIAAILVTRRVRRCDVAGHTIRVSVLMTRGALAAII